MSRKTQKQMNPEDKIPASDTTLPTGSKATEVKDAGIEEMLNLVGTMVFGPRLKDAQARVDKYNAELDAQIDQLKEGLRSPEVMEMVRTEMKKAAEAVKKAILKTPPIILERKDTGIKNMGRQHKAFPLLAKAVAQGEPVWLAGPSGAGKTTAARLIAEALNRPFAALSCNPQMPESRILGFVDANGTPRDVGNVKRAYREGWVYLFDEIDASNAPVMTSINMLAEAPEYLFPGDTAPTVRHKDFRLIAAANTYGYGATVEYVGRMQLDEATRNRFFFVDWGYDEEFEKDLFGDSRWVGYAHALRKACGDTGVRLTVGPRNIRQAIGGDVQGLTDDQIVFGAFLKGLEPSQVSRLKACPCLAGLPAKPKGAK